MYNFILVSSVDVKSTTMYVSILYMECIIPFKLVQQMSNQLQCMYAYVYYVYILWSKQIFSLYISKHIIHSSAFYCTLYTDKWWRFHNITQFLLAIYRIRLLWGHRFRHTFTRASSAKARHEIYAIWNGLLKFNLILNQILFGGQLTIITYEVR